VLARLRPRLTYANVMATLALFVALGGSSYAALTLTGRNIKNRSITRVDVKGNTLTGSEIREKTLKQVPKARLAATASIADSANLAKNADTATNALTATRAQSSASADLAALANDAQTLAGKQAASFESSSRIAFGSASANPAGASGEKNVLSWPEAGMVVTSASNASNNCGTDLGFAVANPRSAGGAGIVAFQGGSGASFSVGAGAKTYRCAPDGVNNPDSSDAVTLTLLDTGSSRTMFVNCFRVNTGGAADVRCLATRSEP
jgi:hypothetical protein